MNINLTAFRRNLIDTTVSIKFSGIINQDFQLFDPPGHLIENPKGQYGVIFHIKGANDARIETGGTSTIKFKVDFKIKDVKNIRVFFYNDSLALDETALKCFKDFLKIYGLSENAPEKVDCPYPKEKAMAIPRQAGNGGVVGIV